MFGLYISTYIVVALILNCLCTKYTEEEQEVAKKSLPLPLKCDFVLRAVKMS